MKFDFLHKFPGENPLSLKPVSEGHVREIRKIETIPTDILYAENGNVLLNANGVGALRVEPSVLEVYQAVAAGDTDDRPYDDAHKPALYAEFQAQSQGNLGIYLDNIRKYHARRVAYFVLTPWKNHIIGLDKDGLRDGGHRFRAAMFMGWDEVWVERPKTDEEAAEPAAQA